MLDVARREPATHGKAASSRIITLSEGGPQYYLPASSSVGRCCCHLGAALRCFLGDSRMLPSTWLHSCSMGVEHCVSTQELSDCSLSAAELTRSPAEPPNPVTEVSACQLKQASVLDMFTLGCHPLCYPCAEHSSHLLPICCKAGAFGTPGSGVHERAATESRASQSLEQQLMPASVAAAYACAASPMVQGAFSSSPLACIACMTT